MADAEPPTVDEVPPKAGLSGGVLTIVFLAVVGLGSLAAWLGRDDASNTVETGQPAPPFAVTTFDGERFDLDRHIDGDGGPVLLNLWASWCLPCVEEFPVLGDFALSHPDVTVVGVAVQDQEESAREFAQQLDPPFLVAWDEGDRVRDAYPAFGLPVTFLIDGDGTVVDIIIARLTPERMADLAIGA